MSASLFVEDVVVSFGGLKALDGATIRFEPNTISALIGPNGSGKSTLVNRVSGQLPGSGGRIFLGEEDITNISAHHIASVGLARTYQIPLFPPELTVQEVISVPLRYIGRQAGAAPDFADVQSIARFCELSRQLDHRCSELSVPDLRRLEVARALACSPKVLLLDEVMAGLSLSDAEQVVRLVRGIHETGVTIVVIEHVMRIVVQLCSAVVVLNQGRLLASGAPRTVLTNSAVREAYLGRGFEL
jgi:branched-chain amino acid transport system ATP-binding protein